MLLCSPGRSVCARRLKVISNSSNIGVGGGSGIFIIIISISSSSSSMCIPHLSFKISSYYPHILFMSSFFLA